MPRTKSFDVDEVLDRAVDLFWVNGFAATSMEDLVQHLGINRGSLYATFGSKEELFERALNRYHDQNVTWMTDLLADIDRSLRDRLAELLHASLTSADFRGCLTVNSAAERNAVHDGTRAITNDAVRQMRALLIEAFENATDSTRPGDAIVETVTPELAADFVIVAMQGLRVRSTMIDDSSALAGVAAAALDTVFGPT